MAQEGAVRYGSWNRSRRRSRSTSSASTTFSVITPSACPVSTGGAPSASGSASRQQPGCWSNFSHHAHGTKGFVSFDGGDAVVIQLKGSQPKRLKPGRDGHQTEWDDRLAAVVANRPYNELDWAVDSTMTAILDATPRSRRKRTAFIRLPCRASPRPSDRGQLQLERALAQIGHGQNNRGGQGSAKP